MEERVKRVFSFLMGFKNLSAQADISAKPYFRFFSKLIFAVLAGLVLIINGYAQMYPPNNFMIGQPNPNMMANSSAFKQEIARLEIRVVRPGKVPLSITQVPRLEKDDILKVRLLDEQVNGVKPSDSNFDWTFLVAYINPGRNNDKQKTVSEEVNFKRKGWYKEYSFVVPYDSQPIFFLYPKPQYRSKILELVNKNKEEIQKVGEKTIEIADAYAKIGSFLNELQSVVYRNYYRNLYSGYGMYGTYPNGYNTQNNMLSYNDHFLTEQAIERIAKSFNIQLPACWGGSNQYYQGGMYNNGYNNYGGYYNGYGMGNDFVGRVQCVARSVRIEDFDISVSKMLQQGGVFAAAQLAQKYPQLSFWINIAAVALDFILKVTNRTPLKIVPTIVNSSDNSMPASFQPNAADGVKISLFAESQPNENGFVTAYPLVFHKWQANSDPNVINLPLPVLADSCLHSGQNIIRTTDVVNDWMTDNFTKEFQLTISAENGFRKDFPLKKNVGLNGWELNITKEELNTIPKINMNLEGVIKGKRGFNEIQSPKFDIQMSSSGNWIVEENSRKGFTVGGKRQITLINQSGNCRCLEAAIYKPMFGGQFVFDAKNLRYSPDGKEVSFEVDTKEFPSGTGQLELRHYGGEVSSINLNLYPLAPNVNDLKIAKGDNQVILVGERLDQVKAVRLNGRRAFLRTDTGADFMNSQNIPVNSGQKTIPTNSPANIPTLGEKTFVFEDLGRWQDSSNIILELELEDQRTFQAPNLFSVSPSRPIIAANEMKEIDAFVVNNSNVKNTAEFSELAVFPIETSMIGVNLQNSLTDFDFKIENLKVETRLENTQVNPFEPSDVNFEVLDWRSIRLDLKISEQARKMLGGRRIQFRITDKLRGSSDWYSIRQTFVRTPQISSFKCLADQAKQCELIGTGINYIQQISFDNGTTWYPEQPVGLVSKPTANGLESVMIPNIVGNKQNVKIRLRDFSKSQMLPLSNFLKAVR